MHQGLDHRVSGGRVWGAGRGRRCSQPLRSSVRMHWQDFVRTKLFCTLKQQEHYTVRSHLQTVSNTLTHTHSGHFRCRDSSGLATQCLQHGRGWGGGGPPALPSPPFSPALGASIVSRRQWKEAAARSARSYIPSYSRLRQEDHGSLRWFSTLPATTL